MLRLAAEQNFNNDIVRGLLRRQPDLDLVRLHDVGLSSADDRAVLDWCARERRCLLTHDAATITSHAYDRIRAGLAMPGVFEVRPDLPVGPVIEDVLLIALYSRESEWEGQVIYLPLR